MKKKKKISKAVANVQRYFPKVTKVIDADTPVSVQVTSADDKAGKRYEQDVCAMAVACKRTFKVDGVIVSRKVGYLVRGDVATRYNLPESVSREVVSFDRGAGFAPGQYQMTPPEPSRRLGRMTGGNKQSNGNGRPKRVVHQTSNVRAVLGSKAAR